MMISDIAKAGLFAGLLVIFNPATAAEVGRLELHSSGHIASSTCETSGFQFSVKVKGTIDDSAGQDAVTFRLLDGKGNDISNTFIMLPIGKTFESSIMLAVSINTFGNVTTPKARPFKIEAIESGVPFSTDGTVLAAATFDPSGEPAGVGSCAFLPEETPE